MLTQPCVPTKAALSRCHLPGFTLPGCHPSAGVPRMEAAAAWAQRFQPSAVAFLPRGLQCLADAAGSDPGIVCSVHTDSPALAKRRFPASHLLRFCSSTDCVQVCNLFSCFPISLVILTFCRTRNDYLTRATLPCTKQNSHRVFVAPSSDHLI